MSKWEECKADILIYLSAQRLEKRTLQSDREKAERAKGKKLLESIKSFERSLFKGSANADLDLTRKVSLESIITDEMNKKMSLGNRISNALSTLSKHTTGSARFFRSFRPPRASTKITELDEIDDWSAVLTSDPNSYTSQRTGPATTQLSIMNVARSYYSYLYTAKESRLNPTHLSEYLSHLRANPIDPALRDKAEAPLTTADVKAAIMNLKLGKTCGPDALPSELYRYHVDTLAPILCLVFETMRAKGTLSPTMRQGDTTLLHKKEIPH